MSECPVVHIHKVTDGGDAGPEARAAGKCPVDHTAMKKPAETQEVEQLDIDVDQIGDTPSVKEYKKLKKVMAMITKFYYDGSEKKRGNYETMVEQLGNLEADKNMCEEQLKALDSNPGFKIHPKSKQYRKNLNEELEGLNKQKANLEKHRDEYHDLYQWSKKIVEICEYLENHFDHYAKEKIPDLNPILLKNLKPAKALSPEEMVDYSKGLAEITYNLAESQDFFAASVDGRLKKYHAIEKKIIEAQIEAISKFPEDSMRKMYIMDELQKDLAYVEGLMVEDPSSINRKSKMLKNHQEFLKVLVYHREKLGVLGDVPELQYNPKYDHYTE